MKRYSIKPLVITKLFDTTTYNLILEFMDRVVPSLPKDRDTNLFYRACTHNTPFFVDIHNQLKDYASDLFGEKVKPSYAFLSMYDKGGKCPLHIDRPQCRYTIDYLIRQDANQVKPWPIDIGPFMTDEERDGIENRYPTEQEDLDNVINSVSWTRCNLNPNDAVCYSGTNAWHYRPEQSLGKCDLVFFHFVPEKFDGPLN